MKDFFISLIPHCEKTLTIIGASAGAVCSFLFGEWTDSLTWLVVFMIADFFIGTAAALKTGEWSSDVGLKGIGRKAITWVIVVIGHGLDISLNIHLVSLRDIIVCAFLVNEAGSILENIGKIDPHAVPAPIREMLASLKRKTDKDIQKLEDLTK